MNHRDMTNHPVKSTRQQALNIMQRSSFRSPFSPACTTKNREGDMKTISMELTFSVNDRIKELINQQPSTPVFISKTLPIEIWLAWTVTILNAYILINRSYQRYNFNRGDKLSMMHLPGEGKSQIWRFLPWNLVCGALVTATVIGTFMPWDILTAFYLGKDD